jgi:hypothetical protein
MRHPSLDAEAIGNTRTKPLPVGYEFPPTSSRLAQPPETIEELYSLLDAIDAEVTPIPVWKQPRRRVMEVAT